MGHAETSGRDNGLLGNPALGRIVFLCGMVMLLCSTGLTIRTYMPCPFWDEWDVIADIANGQGPWSWAWLWSQHNEHRIAIPRLLIWLDVMVFRGKNVSLFVELWVVQILHWASISFVIQRFTNFPESLKRTLQGLFALCLFNINQAQNFTWAFQVSFVLPFAIGTTALLGIAFIENVGEKTPMVLAWAAVAPVIASGSLASGLLIGPTVVLLACLKRLRWSETFCLLMAFAFAILLYLHGYWNNGLRYLPLQAISAPLDLGAYVLTYFDSSWMPLSTSYRLFALISLLCLAVLAVQMIRHPKMTTNFEWFCLAECIWILTTAIVTAAGRLHLGIDQASSSRYQTPAMLYWASFLALSVTASWRRWPSRMTTMQQLVLVGGLCWLAIIPMWWQAAGKEGGARCRACAAIERSQHVEQSIKLLYPTLNGRLQAAMALLYGVKAPQ